ncbi:MAG TPA: TonB-dependent receptor [Candidatus Acidoferrum sp.]|nr:TonB-dependent receptor [Candidatus Acidoferrum sp.]
MVRNWTIVLSVVALLCLPGFGAGQSTFGDVVGVVKDPGQGAVGGAQVTLTNADEHTQHTATTDADGAFHFVNLKPGHYELVVAAAGFADYKVTAMQLDARQTLRLDVVLKLASAAQSIEVGGDSGPVINTENATLGDTKDFSQITNLPVNYRGATTSPLAMLATVPGAQQDANGNVSVGGGLPSQVQYSVDGSSTVNIRQNGALGNMNPSSELISEFKVTQFNNNAEFSQVGDVTISTKSGTEAFHGSVFEYFQNSALDAAVWGSNINGDTLKPHKVFHTFGGSLGGPLNIPKLSHGKAKTFFFTDYEGNRKRYSTPLFLFVPTNAMRSGDFSAQAAPLMDPFTGKPYPGNKIPSGSACTSAQDCINPVATALLNFIPAPNINVSAANFGSQANYLQQTPTPSNTNGFDTRIDRTLTSKQSIFVRWSWKHLDGQSLTDAYLGTLNSFLPPDNDLEHNNNILVSHNYLITDHLVNEARFGVSLWELQVHFPIEGATAISELGLQGLDISDHPTTGAFPIFNFSDDPGNYSPIGRDKDGTTKSTTIQLADNLTWIHGRHTMKFGADVRRVGYQDIESFGGADDFGDFTFDQGVFTGNAFANLLLGLPTKTYVAQSGPDVHAHATQTGVYGQDEFRLNDRLTLSFGLRWQALPPFVSSLNNLTAFDVHNGGVIIPLGNQPRAAFLESINTCVAGSGITCGVPTAADSALGCVPVNAALPCAPVEFANTVGLGPGLREFYRKNVQPRLGFAYRPFGNNKTVVRGGFGIFTMTNLGQLSFNTTNIDVAVVRTTFNPDATTGAPTYQFPSVRTPDNPLLIAGTGDFYQNTLTNYRDPQSAQWNFTIERELAHDLTLRESYVGMASYRMSETVDLNQVEPSTISPNPNPKPYPNWGRILSTTNEGHVNYNGLQSELNLHARGGLTLQASHVWAKNLGNVGGDAPTAFNPEIIYGTPVANRFDLSADRGNMAGTRRNRFLVTALYDLPAGRNRKYFSHMKAVPEAILGGWSFSTVSLWETGPYLTPITSSSYDPGNLNISYRGAIQRPDCTGNPNVANAAAGSMFDINAINPIPAGPVGNCGVGILEGPGTTTIAAGLSKNFHLTERFRLRFEGTFTNLLNHPNFAPPPTNVTASSFGIVQSVQTAENSGNRTGQLSLRLDF